MSIRKLQDIFSFLLGYTFKHLIYFANLVLIYNIVLQSFMENILIYQINWDFSISHFFFDCGIPENTKYFSDSIAQYSFAFTDPSMGRNYESTLSNKLLTCLSCFPLVRCPSMCILLFNFRNACLYIQRSTLTIFLALCDA